MFVSDVAVVPASLPSVRRFLEYLVFGGVYCLLSFKNCLWELIKVYDKSAFLQRFSLAASGAWSITSTVSLQSTLMRFPKPSK